MSKNEKDAVKEIHQNVEQKNRKTFDLSRRPSLEQKDADVTQSQAQLAQALHTFEKRHGGVTFSSKGTSDSHPDTSLFVEQVRRKPQEEIDTQQSTSSIESSNEQDTVRKKIQA